MRFAIATIFVMVIPSLSAMAEEVVVTKPGVMCASSRAIAQLTLPGGDSLTHQPNPDSADLQAFADGRCKDMSVGSTMSRIKAFKNTAIVTEWNNESGRDYTVFIAPNMDLAPKTAVSSLDSPSPEQATAPGPAPATEVAGSFENAGCREDAGYAAAFAARRDQGVSEDAAYANMKMSVPDSQKASLYGFVLIDIYERHQGETPQAIERMTYNRCVAFKQAHPDAQ